MLHVDGTTYSGSGTLLRYAVALATLKGEPLHIFNIRAKRNKPGLRAQHLTALRACAALSSGHIEGDDLNSKEVFFWPGVVIDGGEFGWDIGTAGSATMLAFTLIAPALYAETRSCFTITGGLFQDFAPTAFHMQHVLLPALQRMGAKIAIEIVRPGYVPQGHGCLRVTVQPSPAPLTPLKMPTQGKTESILGISLSSHLQEERVSERMAERSRDILRQHNIEPRIEIQHDFTALQKGAALALWATTSEGCVLGADRAGKRGRRSEAIAEHVCRMLLEDLNCGATTDRHLADQLILFTALAKGESEYQIPRTTSHIQSNLWLVREMLGASWTMDGSRLKIQGVGHSR